MNLLSLAPLLMASTPAADTTPSNQPLAGQVLCDLIGAEGQAVNYPSAGCRWSALADRPLLQGEVVELAVRNIDSDFQRKSMNDGYLSYFQQLQNGHLFTDLGEFNPCPQHQSGGRSIRVYHRHHVEKFGYAQCGNRMVTLKVYLLKTGGSGPSDVFDDIAQKTASFLTGAH